MSDTRYALMIGAGALAVALLAVAGIIPESVAQMVPLAVVPLVILRRNTGCGRRGRTA